MICEVVSNFIRCCFEELNLIIYDFNLRVFLIYYFFDISKVIKMFLRILKIIFFYFLQFIVLSDIFLVVLNCFTSCLNLFHQLRLNFFLIHVNISQTFEILLTFNSKYIGRVVYCFFMDIFTALY